MRSPPWGLKLLGLHASIPLLKTIRKHLSTLLATFFYVGLSPKAPGTLGSLAALPFAYFLWLLPPIQAWMLFLVCLALGIWSAGEVVRRTRLEDNQCIVIDEVLGVFLTTSLISLRHFSLSPKQTFVFYASAFFLFRLFDIWKPGPVRWIDRKVKGGFGVVLDDLAAALLALILLAIGFQP